MAGPIQDEWMQPRVSERTKQRSNIGHLLAPSTREDRRPKGATRYVASVDVTLKNLPGSGRSTSSAATYSRWAHNSRNFVFRRHFPIHQIFERSCDMGLVRLTADTVSRIFGVRVH